MGAGVWDLGWGVGLWGFSGTILFIFLFFLRIGLEIGLGIWAQDLGHVVCFSGWSGVAGMDG